MLLMRPISAMFFFRLEVSLYSSLIRLTASSEPNAFLSKSDSLTFNESPNLPLIFSSMVSMPSMLPLLSVNLRPSSFWALPTPARKALYLVPASLPLMVDCSMPSTAICSWAEMPAAWALAPRAVNAALISMPVVLKICTA